eukprot:SAG31_NODE_30478_length_380_cov_1.555160_1_plen_33_part_10
MIPMQCLLERMGLSMVANAAQQSEASSGAGGLH